MLEATALRLANESGVPRGWSPAVGFNLHFQNRQEYAEVCKDVAALHEKALAERNLRRVTPDLPPDQEKEWIRCIYSRVFGRTKNDLNIFLLEPVSPQNRATNGHLRLKTS